MLLEGLHRIYRFVSLSRARPKVVPPYPVLRAYFQTHPEFVVEDEKVRSAEPLDYRNELGTTETILVDVLRASPGGALDRRTFATECARRSMN